MKEDTTMNKSIVLQALIDEKINKQMILDKEIEKLEMQLSMELSIDLLSSGLLGEGTWFLTSDYYGKFQLSAYCKEFPLFIEKYCKGLHAKYTLDMNIDLIINYEDNKMHIMFIDVENDFTYLGDDVVKAFIAKNNLKVELAQEIHKIIERCQKDLVRYCEHRDRAISFLK